jgi:nucleoside-diphosphate-sugar epimerase
VELRPITVPLTIMWPACFLVEQVWGLMGKEPPFSTRSLKFFTESSAFDISKAKRILGFQPSVGIREGMELTVKQFTDEGLL